MNEIFSAFEEFLKSAKPKIPSFHPHFENAFWEMLENGGKRFRPKLLLALVSFYAAQTSHIHSNNALKGGLDKKQNQGGIFGILKEAFGVEHSHLKPTIKGDSIYFKPKKSDIENLNNSQNAKKSQDFQNIAPLVRAAFWPALAMECLHTYSLIHDDLPAMDNSPLRRGKPTLHAKYDESTAILCGDGLNTYSFFLLSSAPFNSKIRIKLVRLLAKRGGIGGMVLGQALDCAFENKPLELRDLRLLHRLKTAELISCALEMGAIIVGAKKKERRKLRTFGRRLGLFFQIRDDIIDATQSSNEAGKPTNSDSAKNSYVNLLGLDEAKKALHKISKKLQKELNKIHSGAALREILEEYFKA